MKAIPLSAVLGLEKSWGGSQDHDWHNAEEHFDDDKSTDERAPDHLHLFYGPMT